MVKKSSGAVARGAKASDILPQPGEVRRFLQSPEGRWQENQLRKETNSRYLLRTSAETEQYPFAS